MCGFFGVLNPRADVDYFSENTKLLNCMKHRGPDKTALMKFSNHFFIHHRLAIQDLSVEGDQPVTDENKEVLVIFNGEIYNFRELDSRFGLKTNGIGKNSDTQTILRLYQKLGSEFIHHLEGIFSFAIVDLKRKIAILASDPFGTKPLYYSNSEDGFIFASEIKAVIQAKGNQYQGNQSMVFHYLRTGQVENANQTLFQGIFRVPPATIVEFDLNSEVILKKSYFTLEEEVANIEIHTNQEFILQLLDDSILYNLHGDVRKTLALSSGIDSRFLLSRIENLVGLKLTKYIFGFREAEYNEISRVEEVFGSEISDLHSYISVEDTFLDDLKRAIHFFDSPLGGVGTLAQYQMMRKVSECGDKVILTGEGSDEIFGGYDYYNFGFLLDNSHSSDFASLAKKFSVIYGQELTEDELNRGYQKAVAPISLAPDSTSGFLISDFMDSYSKWYERVEVWEKDLKLTRTQILRILDIKYKKLPKLLHFLDRSGASNGVEARVPFLSKRLVVNSLGLEPRLLFDSGLGKDVLRRNLDLRGYGSSVYMRKHQVATPQREWLKNCLQKDKFSYLLEGRLLESGIIEKSELMNRINTYIMTDVTKSNSFFLWQLLNFEMFLELYPAIL